MDFNSKCGPKVSSGALSLPDPRSTVKSTRVRFIEYLALFPMESFVSLLTLLIGKEDILSFERLGRAARAGSAGLGQARMPSARDR